MWFLHIMLRISYKDMMINEEVLRRANVDRSLMKDIVKRQMEFFRYVIRKEISNERSKWTDRNGEICR